MTKSIEIMIHEIDVMFGELSGRGLSDRSPFHYEWLHLQTNKTVSNIWNKVFSTEQKFQITDKEVEERFSNGLIDEDQYNDDHEKNMYDMIDNLGESFEGYRLPDIQDF